MDCVKIYIFLISMLYIIVQLLSWSIVALQNYSLELTQHVQQVI